MKVELGKVDTRFLQQWQFEEYSVFPLRRLLMPHRLDAKSSACDPEHNKLCGARNQTVLLLAGILAGARLAVIYWVLWIVVVLMIVFVLVFLFLAFLLLLFVE